MCLVENPLFSGCRETQLQPSSGLLPLLDKAANKASFEKGGGLELVCTIHNNFTPEIGIQSKHHPIEKEYHLNQPFIFGFQIHPNFPWRV